MSDIIIRTSDRQAFKRCRRKWKLSATPPLGMNRVPIQTQPYFWLGTGGHFAMEDWYGYNQYGDPLAAFEAYVQAQRLWDRGAHLPDDWEEQVTLGKQILTHYKRWLVGRQDYPTYWHNGEPQVEVRIQKELPIPAKEGINFLYDATLDRVVEIDGELWIDDYKFLKQFASHNLDMDEQITSYLWLGTILYERPVVGMIYHQFKKDVPALPRVLKNGSISTDVRQKTTQQLYREALIEKYGAVKDAPPGNRECLNTLIEKETDESDGFIRRDYTRRSDAQLRSLGERVMAETLDMTDPNIFLYPNFTKDCSWDCPYSDVCLMMENDEDWEPYLEEVTTVREDDRDAWREFLPEPEQEF